MVKVYMNYTFIFDHSDRKTIVKENMVVMYTCAKDCKEDCVSYKTPLGQCNNAAQLFPNDPQWSEFDWYDAFRSHSEKIIRTFYKSTNGTCTFPTETIEIPLDINVGPIGLPRSCGKFTVT